MIDAMFDEIEERRDGQGRRQRKTYREDLLAHLDFCRTYVDVSSILVSIVTCRSTTSAENCDLSFATTNDRLVLDLGS